MGVLSIQRKKIINSILKINEELSKEMIYKSIKQVDITHECTLSLL